MNQPLQIHNVQKSNRALESLQQEASASQKYVRARQLVHKKEYAAARQRVLDDFLITGNHAYRDVARLFAFIVEAEQRKLSFRRRYSAFLNANVIILMLLLIITSYALGAASSLYINFEALIMTYPMILLGAIGFMWFGSIVFFLLNRRNKF